MFSLQEGGTRLDAVDDRPTPKQKICIESGPNLTVSEP